MGLHGRSSALEYHTLVLVSYWNIILCILFLPGYFYDQDLESNTVSDMRPGKLWGRCRCDLGCRLRARVALLSGNMYPASLSASKWPKQPDSTKAIGYAPNARENTNMFKR